MKNKSEKILVIAAITILLVTLSIIVPIIVKGDNNDAGKAQVLSGKTFTNGSAVAIAGQMQNFGGQIPEVTATAADEDYIATIDLDDGYYESVKINAKPIYDRGVAAGAASIPRLTSSNFSGTHSGTTAGEASTYTVKSTSAGYVENDTTVASLTAETSPTIATTSATGTQTINVTPGYYNKISVNQTNAYDKGKTDATASATKVYYLGTGTSFNVKSKLPNDYNKLTNANFIVGASGIGSATTRPYSYGKGDITFSVGTKNISKSYNASTGVLTLSNTSYSITTTHPGGVTASGNFSCFAYAVVGTIN